jgi:preprotein translocase subunit YajC
MFMQDILIQILLVLGVLVVAYIFLIRPQLRRITEHNRLLSSLELGDQVVTGGGLIGTIVKLEGADIVEIKLSEAMRVRALRSSIEKKVEERHASNADFTDLADSHNTSIPTLGRQSSEASPEVA